MAEITFFAALPFDFVDGGIAAGEPIECASPAAAIERAQGLWKVGGPHFIAVDFFLTALGSGSSSAQQVALQTDHQALQEGSKSRNQLRKPSLATLVCRGSS